MRWKQIYSQFQHMFPSLDKGVTRWSKYESHSIKLETTAHITLIFEYYSVKDWTLTTSRDRNRRIDE